MYPVSLPLKKGVDTAKIAGIFSHVTMSYKYYFFIAILHILQTRQGSVQIINRQSRDISAQELAATILGLAFHARVVYQLKFGIKDTLCKAIDALKDNLDLKDSMSTQDIIDTILKNASGNKAVLSIFEKLLKYVPIKFLSPWTGSFKDTGDCNKQVSLLSRDKNINAPYVLNLNDFGSKCISISVNNCYYDYFLENMSILKDFSYYNLALYMHRNNIGVPNLLDKIVYQTERNSLNVQRGIFTKFLNIHPALSCIYSHRIIDKSSYALDHFMPWSFIAHNQIWNLIPVPHDINSIKSNGIPDLNKYLNGFVQVHQSLIRDINQKNLGNLSDTQKNAIRDYQALGYDIKELAALNDKEFFNIMLGIMKPLAVQASYCGFKDFVYL